jgi:hypothetical protein
MNESASSENLSTRGLWLLLGTIFIVWIASGFALYALPERGTFGDMFGAVNALFSGLAFASLIYTILLQRQELRLQREELHFTRKEIEGQKLQLVAQNEVLRQQNFENTFFQSLRLMQELVNALDMGKGDGVVHGRDCITRLYRFYHTAYSNEKARLPNTEMEGIISNAYAKFYDHYGFEIGHYFRTLYNLVKLVHASQVQNKRFYTNLIRAQLSDHELGLLFYNCLSPLGKAKFKPLVEEYALLKNMPMRLIHDPDHRHFYAPHAFGDDQPPVQPTHLSA